MTVYRNTEDNKLYVISEIIKPYGNDEWDRKYNKKTPYHISEYLGQNDYWANNITNFEKSFEI